MKLLAFCMLISTVAVNAYDVDPSKHEWLIEVKSNQFCNVTLTCQFNNPVYCLWKRKDRVVDMGSRYNYDKGSRESVKDCSLDITFLTRLDFTYWTCEGYATADLSKSPKFKTVYRISHEMKMETDYQNTNHSLPSSHVIFDKDRCTRTPGTLYSQSLVLLKNHTTSTNNYYCKFNNHVDQCTWKSSNDVTMQDQELEYGKRSGQDTDDCTMKTGPRFLKTKKISRCEAKKELITLTPKTGSTVSLSCHAVRPVKCTWKRNHDDTPITGRYKYDSPNVNGTQDCSIKITNYSANDNGLWMCFLSKGTGETDEGHKVLNSYFLN